MEDLDAKLDLIVEKVESSEKRLTVRIDDLEAKLTREIRDVQTVVRVHSEKIQKHDQEISILQTSRPLSKRISPPLS